jgi:hypothetical protein
MNLLRNVVLALGLGFVGFVACGQVQPVSPKILGLLEVSFADAKAKAVFMPSRLRPQGLTVNSGALLDFNVADFISFDQVVPAERTLTQIIQITNNSATAFQNLSFVAYAKTGNNASSALKEMSTFGGTPSDSDVYGILPAHGTDGTALLAPFRSDLQLYTTDEAIGLTADARAANVIGALEFALEYGFVARHNGSSHARGIGASGCSGIDCNKGQVALSMRLPASADVSSGQRFVMTFIVVENSQSHVVQSLEEDLAGADALARASGVGIGTQIRAFRNSSLTSANRDFDVLIAGSSSDPKAFLRAKATQTQLDAAQAILDSESAWLQNSQFTNPSLPANMIGAIANHPTELAGHPTANTTGRIVDPYFANLALIGLLEAKGADAMTLAVIKRWLNWFLGHINVSVIVCPPVPSEECNQIPGSINNFFYDTSNQEEKLLKIDSIDSYASTFLVLLQKYYFLSNDTQLIVDNREKIRWIRNTNLYESNFLNGIFYSGTWRESKKRTIAKLNHMIEYLMDNSEVRESFLALKSLASVPNLLETVPAEAQTLSFDIQNRIDSINLGIEQLYDSSKGLYASYFGAVAKISPFYDTAHGDAAGAAQLFPIITGLLPNPRTNPRAKALWSAFKSQYPNWNSVDVTQTAGFPWALMAYAAALMGDYWQLETYFQNIKSKYIDLAHKGPYYIAEAGWLLRATNHILKNP